MKKAYILLLSPLIFFFGLLLRFSYTLSGQAAWSFLVSSVNASGWELMKPFALSYISAIVISLSVLRPPLLNFVCDSILGLALLCALLLISGTLCSFFGAHELIYELCALCSVCAGVLLQFFLFRHGVRTGLFAAPLILFLCIMLFMILFLSFYPLPYPVFYDHNAGLFGRTLTFDALREYRKQFVTIFL